MSKVYLFSKRADGTYRIGFSPYYGIVSLFGYTLFYGSFLHKLAAPIRFISYFTPKAWAVGAHCCDHAGQITSWHFTYTLYDGQMHNAPDSGDGPDTWCRIPWATYVSKRLKGVRRVYPDLTWVYEQIDQ